MSLNELRKKREELDKRRNNTLNNMDKIIGESLRVADVAHNSKEVLDNLDREFEKQTGLKGIDVTFLFFATALQVIKWAILPELGNKIDKDNRISDKEGDQKVKAAKKNYSDNHSDWDVNKSKKSYKSWKEIVYSSVPYDATKGAPALGINMEGRYHRYKTLGHDPVLGWVFGTMNIISDTITLNDFRTFNIENMHFKDQTSVFSAFSRSFESIVEDKHRLPAAIFRQGLHYQSDKYTKLGLPIPILGIFSEKLAGNLYRSQYDMLCLSKDFKKVGESAKYAILINMVISLVHGLFYDETKYSNRDLYEVKTRKILSYSNAIASGSNVIYVAINAYLGNEGAIKKLDIGGIIVTIHRLLSDSEFIRKVKEEFVFGSFNKMIQGEEYDF